MAAYKSKLLEKKRVELLARRQYQEEKKAKEEKERSVTPEKSKSKSKLAQAGKAAMAAMASPRAANIVDNVTIRVGNAA